jgi:hypothetical protein
MTGRRIPPSGRCDALAASLDLDVESSGVCLACLSFVSMPLADGDEAAARREARRLVADLWHEGLEEPVIAALVCARHDGVPGAEAALDDIDARGPRATVVRAVVLRLAAELAEQARAEFRLLTDARARASRGVPELN